MTKRINPEKIFQKRGLRTEHTFPPTKKIAIDRKRKKWITRNRHSFSKCFFVMKISTQNIPSRENQKCHIPLLSTQANLRISFLSARFWTIFHLTPYFFPFFTPTKRTSTNAANFLWQIRFLFHSISVKNLRLSFRMVFFFSVLIRSNVLYIMLIRWLDLSFSRFRSRKTQKR